MAKSGKLKRSERRHPEVHPTIHLPTPSNPAPPTSNQDLHRPHNPPPPAPKPANPRGKTKPSKQRAKSLKAIENADKLAHKAALHGQRNDKRKRAKA